MPPIKRQRGYCFTLNNWTQEQYDIIVGLRCRYVVVGKEVAPITGTPHLQGYIHFTDTKSKSAARILLVGCHVTMANGTAEQNRLYCSKGGDFVERGDIPVEPSVNGAVEVARWDAAWDSAKRGDLEAIPVDIRLRYYSTVKRIAQDYMPRVPNLADVCGVWIFGGSGVGKSRSVGFKFPTAFEKPRNKWWDGYQGEQVVVCDDVDKYNVALGGDFKDWSDYKTFIGEFKGGSRRVRPKLFLVTSQYKISQIWSDPETQEALGRRFVEVEKIAGVDLVWPVSADIEEEVILVE